MDAADFDFGTDEDWNDIAAGVAADEARRSRDASAELPVPEVGSDGDAWRLASGDRLNGAVTSVEGRKVHGTHSSACHECPRTGGACPRCGGSGEYVRRVRLYTPHEVESGLTYRKRRVDARAREAAGLLMATKAEHGDFFNLVARLDARARVPFVDEVMATVERTGTLSQAQREVVEGKCARLARLDDQRRRSVPVGTVGEMMEAVLTCRSARMGREVPFAKRSWRKPDKESVWSLSYTTADGSVLQEKQWADEPRARPGDVVRLRAKVKSHEAFDGVMRTFLTHARVLEVLRTSSIQAAIDANPMPASAGAPEGGTAVDEAEEMAAPVPGM